MNIAKEKQAAYTKTYFWLLAKSTLTTKPLVLQLINSTSPLFPVLTRSSALVQSVSPLSYKWNTYNEHKGPSHTIAQIIKKLYNEINLTSKGDVATRLFNSTASPSPLEFTKTVSSLVDFCVLFTDWSNL